MPDSMTTAAKLSTIDVGEVLARELVFSQGGADASHRYILQPKGSPEDYLSTIRNFPAHSIKRTSEYYIDDTAGRWFTCYNVDCFDPPFAVIRARSLDVAYEVFCDEFADWLAVDESDAADYPEDERNYNGNGVHIDTSNVQIHELTLLSILL